MIPFKTLKEKADEWNVSLRHLQYLCKNGKIDGAVKKAGVWFIPNDAPVPTQYTKGKNGHFNFVGTKKKIFICAIELFKARGFEAVSIKDIADSVGITPSSIYNHFKSKQKILDTIYDFYYYYFLKDRPLMEEIEPVLRDGSLLDVVSSVTYNFGEDYFMQMTDITAIIFYRCAIDERARELTRALMIDEGVRFVETTLKKAVEIKRIASIDTGTMALLINSIRIFVLHRWLSDPTEETRSRLAKEEADLYKLISGLLTDMKSPDEKPCDI